MSGDTNYKCGADWVSWKPRNVHFGVEPFLTVTQATSGWKDMSKFSANKGHGKGFVSFSERQKGYKVANGTKTFPQLKFH